jgi:hypothetical protein
MRHIPAHNGLKAYDYAYYSEDSFAVAPI